MDRTVGRHLAGAELWARIGGLRGRRAIARPVFVAGWEDGDHFCATVCSTDPGLSYCRRCPESIVTAVLTTGHAAGGRCQAGGRLLAFPAPRGSRRTVAVLRVKPPTPREAALAATPTKVAPDALRRAARGAPGADGRAALAAARALRDPGSLVDWQVRQRERSSDRRRTATAALAQMVATSEEFYELLQASERQRAEIERHQRRLDRLARDKLKASDMERAKIAHQIHDTAAQSLVSAYRFLEAARASSPRGREPLAAPALATKAGRRAAAQPVARGAPEQLLPSPDHADAGSAVEVDPPSAVDTYLEAASDRLVAAIGEVRGVLAHLLPPGLEELGVAQAIRNRMDTLSAESGLAMELSGDLPRLDGWVEQAIYGMAVEAMTNAVRHADAAHVTVELSERRGRAVVTISDDGRGFDPDRTERRAAGQGLGLLGINRQATWLGGTASIRSHPGAGSLVRISIPVARHRAAVAGPTPSLPRS